MIERLFALEMVMEKRKGSSQSYSLVSIHAVYN